MRIMSIAVLVAEIVCHAQPQDRWKTYFESRQFGDLARDISSESEKWPALDRKNSNIARLFIGRARASVAQGRKLDGPDGKGLIAALGKAGGPVNVVLQDVVYRMLLTDIVTSIINHPENVAQHEAQLKVLGPDPWQEGAAYEVMANYLGSPELKQRFATMADGPHKLAEMDKLFGKSGREWFLTTPTSSVLIDEESPQALIHRIANTHWMASYAAPGLIAYIKAGGRLEELNTQDVTGFFKLMGTSSRAYRFPLYGDRELTPGALIMLRDQFREGARQPQFIKCALE